LLPPTGCCSSRPSTTLDARGAQECRRLAVAAAEGRRGGVRRPAGGDHGSDPRRLGTRLSQAAWLPVLRNLGARVYFGKQLHVATAAKVFDAEGALIDDKVRSLLSEFMAGFASFISAR